MAGLLVLQGLPGIFVEEDTNLPLEVPGTDNEFGVLLPPPPELLLFKDAILWKLLVVVVVVAAVNVLILLLLLLLIGEFQLLDDFNPFKWFIFVLDDGVDTDLTDVGRLLGILLVIS